MIKKKKSILLKFDLVNNLCIEYLKKCFIFYKVKFVLNRLLYLLIFNNFIFFKFSFIKYVGYLKGLICIKNFNKYIWRFFRKIYEYCEIKYFKFFI